MPSCAKVRLPEVVDVLHTQNTITVTASSAMAISERRCRSRKVSLPCRERTFAHAFRVPCGGTLRCGWRRLDAPEIRMDAFEPRMPFPLLAAAVRTGFDDWLDGFTRSLRRASPP